MLLAKPLKPILALCLAAGSAAVCAQNHITISNAWIRATVPAQTATGFFADITAEQGSELHGIICVAAEKTEIHEMIMDSDIMKMRAINSLPLPAGKTVALAPGGYHGMLLGLHQPLQANDNVPVTLVFRNDDGTEQRMELSVPVKALDTAHHHR